MKLDEGNNGWMTGWMHEWMDEWMDDGWVEWMNNVNMATASHEPYHRFCVSKLLGSLAAGAGIVLCGGLAAAGATERGGAADPGAALGGSGMGSVEGTNMLVMVMGSTVT